MQPNCDNKPLLSPRLLLDVIICPHLYLQRANLKSRRDEKPTLALVVAILHTLLTELADSYPVNCAGHSDVDSCHKLEMSDLTESLAVVLVVCCKILNIHANMCALGESDGNFVAIKEALLEVTDIIAKLITDNHDCLDGKWVCIMF